MTEQELKSIVRGREKRTLEYKRAWAEVPSSLYETICAFLNRDGGVIILGAENNGFIPQGVNPNTIDQMCKNISNMSNNPQVISPTFLLQPEIVQVDDKRVIVISVPSSSQVHRVKGKVFDRSTDGDFELRTDVEISALYLRKCTQYSENTIYPYLRLEHLQSETIEKAKNLIRNTRSDHPWLKLSEMDFFKQANLYRHDFITNQEGFTLAALILFGKAESIQSALPYYKVDVVVRIDNKDRYDDRLSLYGNIIDDYEHLMNFMAKHLPDNFYMEGDQRVSLRDKVFREIIANMLVHREYQNPIPTIIEITRDKIIAKNANRPFKAGPVTLANYSRHPKNPHIANFFVQIGRAEHLGSGIRNLYKYTPLYSGEEPKIDDEDIYVVQIGMPQKDIQKDIRKDIQKRLEEKNIHLTSNQMIVMMLLYQDANITRAEIMSRTNLAESSIITCIAALKKKGLLVRVGGRKQGYWVVRI